MPSGVAAAFDALLDAMEGEQKSGRFTFKVEITRSNNNDVPPRTAPIPAPAPVQTDVPPHPPSSGGSGGSKKRKRSTEKSTEKEKRVHIPKPTHYTDTFCQLVGISAADEHLPNAALLALNTYIKGQHLIKAKEGGGFDQRFFKPDAAMERVWDAEFWGKGRTDCGHNRMLTLRNAVKKMEVS